MRTATSNLIILTAQISDVSITGTAIDGDILVNFAIAKTDVNQRLFVPEANLVVTGKFRLATTIATIGMWITAVIAVVSIPAPADLVETASILIPTEEPVVEAIVPLTSAQKRAATIAANKAKSTSETALISC
jgi:hypothetical protein